MSNIVEKKSKKRERKEKRISIKKREKSYKPDKTKKRDIEVCNIGGLVV